jgi:hypothetical protein
MIKLSVLSVLLVTVSPCPPWRNFEGLAFPPELVALRSPPRMPNKTAVISAEDYLISNLPLPRTLLLRFLFSGISGLVFDHSSRACQTDLFVRNEVRRYREAVSPITNESRVGAAASTEIPKSLVYDRQ